MHRSGVETAEDGWSLGRQTSRRQGSFARARAFHDRVVHGFVPLLVFVASVAGGVNGGQPGVEQLVLKGEVDPRGAQEAAGGFRPAVVTVLASVAERALERPSRQDDPLRTWRCTFDRNGPQRVVDCFLGDLIAG